jgi:spore photoproduct lyase
MSAELFPGADGKLRYFKPLRLEMYAKMLSWMRRYTARPRLYLCMESPDIWQRVFGSAPACNAAVEHHIQQYDLIPPDSLVLTPR